MKPPKIPSLPTGRRLMLWLVFVAFVTAVVWAVVHFVSPAPPRSLVMSTGVVDGAYHHFGERYQEYLRQNGIRLELKPSSGGVENLHRLNDGTVQAAFVQGGTGLLAVNPDADPDSTPLRSLATVAFEPVWIFSRGIDLTHGLAPLAGKRIAVGVAGSGNFQVATQLLKVYGVEAPADGKPAVDGTRFLTEGGTAVVDLLKKGEIDAAFIIAAPQAPAVKALLGDPAFELASLEHAQGLARRFPYFQTVVLRRGSVDPRHDLPPHDVELLATTANLVVREDLHPALAFLLLEAAREIHHAATLISRPGEFPNPVDTDFPLSSESERYFKTGRPFLQNYLPFWAANFVQRLLLVLVPVAAIIFPLLRVLPDVIAWRRQSRLYRRYGELKFLEEDLAARKLSEEEQVEARARLDHIEEEVLHTKFPLDFTDRVYTLRQHVEFVRAQLQKQVEGRHA